MALNSDGPTVLVDLSNLCRWEPGLRRGQRADLGMLLAIRKAMTASVHEFSGLYCVADRSLAPLFDVGQQKLFRELKSKGLIEIHDDADQVLLEELFGASKRFPHAAVLSHDFFDDFRTRYPMIQGSTEHFLGWAQTPAGDLAISWRDMQVRNASQILRKEEANELKAASVLSRAVVAPASEYFYRCPSTTCSLARFWPTGIRESPARDKITRTLHCPNCGQQLERLGRRPASVQLLVSVDGHPIMSIVIHEGEHLFLGRTDSSGCIGLDRSLLPDDLDEISREHLYVELSDGQVVVTRPRSSNPTLLHERAREPAAELIEGHHYELTSTRRLEIPSGIFIALAG